MSRTAAPGWFALRAALCPLALAGPLGPAVRDVAAVAPATWRDTLYSYRADEDLSLTQVLERFTMTLGLQLKLADPALGARKVHLSGKGASPATFLDRLAEAQGLDWFVYQGVLHVSARSSAVSERLLLGPQSPSDAKEALIGVGLFESRFGWGEFDTDPPTALVSGPRAYVALVRQLLAVPDDASGRPERPRLMVFRLRHASAADREMRTRDRSVTMPGLVTTLNQVLVSSRSANSLLRSSEPFGESRGRSGQGAQSPWAGLAQVLAGGVGEGEGLLGGVPSGIAAAQLPVPAAAPAASASAPSSAFAAPGAQGGARRTGYGPADERAMDFVPSIAAYTPLNAVLVWDLPSRRDEYRQLINELDVPSRLVEINVTILDVSAKALRDWAVDVTAASRVVGLQFGTDIGPGGGTGVEGSTMALWASDRLQVRLRALESRGEAQIMSRPSVLTLNNVGALLDMNQSAHIKLVGERTSDLRTVTAGTMLKVTPSIIGDDAAGNGSQGIRVTLDIEDGQILDGGGQRSQGGDSPRTSNSAVSTEAVVRPGESLVVGGYRRQDRQVVDKRVPGLSSIPVFGALFRGDSAINDERERLFILTARALP